MRGEDCRVRERRVRGKARCCPAPAAPPPPPTSLLPSLLAAPLLWRVDAAGGRPRHQRHRAARAEHPAGAGRLCEPAAGASFLLASLALAPKRRGLQANGVGAAPAQCSPVPLAHTPRPPPAVCQAGARHPGCACDRLWRKLRSVPAFKRLLELGGLGCSLRLQRQAPTAWPGLHPTPLKRRRQLSGVAANALPSGCLCSAGLLCSAALPAGGRPWMGRHRLLGRGHAHRIARGGRQPRMRAQLPGRLCSAVCPG